MSMLTNKRSHWEADNEETRLQNHQISQDYKSLLLKQAENRKRFKDNNFAANTLPSREFRSSTDLVQVPINESSAKLSHEQLETLLTEKDQVITEKDQIINKTKQTVENQVRLIKNLQDALKQKLQGIEQPGTNRNHELPTQHRPAVTEQSPTPPSMVGIDDLVMTEWYKEWRIKKHDGAKASRLKDIKIVARECRYLTSGVLELRLKDLQDEIQSWMFRQTDENVLKAANVLEALQYVATKEHIPWYIQSDARELFRHWAARRLSGDLFFGIKSAGQRNKSGSPNTDESSANLGGLEKEFEDKKLYQVYGSNGLENGQWWPTQLCTLRDGAHGASQAGIAGLINLGAFSIIISSHSEYTDPINGDVDKGDEIWYTGTKAKTEAGKATKMTSHTKLMIDAYHNKKEIRVIRSHQESKKAPTTPYAPAAGLRYDGLYTIVDLPRCVDATTQHYRFHLKRVPGQLDIRYKDAEQRPNKFELNGKERIARLQSGGHSRRN